MSKKSRIIVGLSGGVDSSVAAYLLKEEGHEVIGVTMAIWDGQFRVTGKHACYGPDEQQEIREAEEIAGLLGIPHLVFDCSAEYKESVLSYFKSEYLEGRTPNPCIRCNQLIKFGLLPGKAEKEGLRYDYFATGHYARTGWDKESGRYLLKKGVDPIKDQTYFLYRLSQDQLSKVLFPLGGYTKKEIRAIARDAGIVAEEKEESQDFYSGDYKDLINEQENPGNIVDSDGNILGMHKGIWNYTIGQRKGLGIAHPEPLYVIGLNKEQNTVVVGTRKETYHSSFTVTDLTWISVVKPDHSLNILCKIRSAQKEKEATLEPMDSGDVKVTFVQPNDSISPGQSAVFYDGDVVIGGGIIKLIEN